ncbi:MAG: ATPase, T2SS/T4P/T4SS family [Candidatus Omnitrophota bacterium]
MALRLGDILVEKKLITAQELELAVKEQERSNKRLGQILVEMKFIGEKRMLEALAGQQGLKFLELKDMKVDEKVIKSVPAKLVWHYKIMPIAIEGNVLTVAVADPFDMSPLDDLETHLGYRVEKALAPFLDITEAIRTYYGVGADTIERILSEQPREEGYIEAGKQEHVENLEKMAEDASVVRLVNQILQQAISQRATDVHIEHFRNELSLRYRRDGILYDMQAPKDVKYLYTAIISRVKVMSGLDIIERRLPQDGRAKVRIADKEYDLRISIIPTLYGENIVIRILPTSMLFSLSELGLAPKDLGIIEQLLARPYGIIFVTGPTGSGKTTTLYTCLNRLNLPERKIVSIEDPIEYEMKGISQIQVNPAIGLTFARALRSILRHDPNIIMLGEVRDTETADIVIQTALTGHLVFSTLHTNDAASGITRLIDIGVEPYLIASSVEAFIAQRLLRVLCPDCKELYVVEDIEYEKLKSLGLKAESKGLKLYRAKGCRACGQTGFSGRIGIYEILLLDNEIKKLILQKTSSNVIKDRAIELGMQVLRDDGWSKVLAGITTPQEIMRVTHTEEIKE